VGFDGAAKGSVLGVGGSHVGVDYRRKEMDGKKKLGRQRSSKLNPRKSNSLGARCALMGLGDKKRAKWEKLEEISRVGRGAEMKKKKAEEAEEVDGRCTVVNRSWMDSRLSTSACG
jgi:hypothetical protein